MDKVLGETLEFLEDFIEFARPKLAAGMKTIVKDTKNLFHNYPARISITYVEPEVVGFNPKDYSLKIEGTPSSPLAELQRSSDKEGLEARTSPKRRSDFKTLMFEYGAPIRVKWTAPLNHSKKDWVGLYMVADNASREVTRVASMGRWVATSPGEFDSFTADIGQISSDLKSTRSPSPGNDPDSDECLSGEISFSGDKLWWTQGVFEFRYHHNGKHNVMAISLPFEVRIARFDDDDIQELHSSSTFSNPTSLQNEALIRSTIERELLPVVQNCFDRDPEIAPRTADEAFGSLVERDWKFAKRVVYAVQAMFGVEFAPEVVQADAKVSNLAWRIWEAKKVLVSYLLM
jgi:phosphatidylethanolamine N-methyltransferase